MNSVLLRRLSLTALWLGLIIFAFGFAPPPDPDTFELIKRLSTGEWQGINPIVIALFNIMGIWPLAFGAVLLVDGRGQKIPARPFWIASFFLGAFALLPYLILRQPNPQPPGELPKSVKLWESPWVGRGLLLGAIACGVGAIGWGDWGDFVHQWQENQFIAVMSSDFLCLCLSFPFLVGDDIQRRAVTQSQTLRRLSLFPLFGALIYLCIRPPLKPLDQSALATDAP